ncbi:hypothetical protein U9M48_004539 [Paspalum notatum var. saurae]|uniref:Uncharacterized protein n=1 Tax=Paspalum notatum var. saurae TaxID=547442 RepID=A0AAQ3SEW3_PASNO
MLASGPWKPNSTNADARSATAASADPSTPSPRRPPPRPRRPAHRRRHSQTPRSAPARDLRDDRRRGLRPRDLAVLPAAAGARRRQHPPPPATCVTTEERPPSPSDAARLRPHRAVASSFIRFAAEKKGKGIITG